MKLAELEEWRLALDDRETASMSMTRRIRNLERGPRYARLSPKQLVPQLADEGLYRATGSNQVWSWDITWLPTVVRGRFLRLYLVMDVWSRRIVGSEVATRESPDIASELIQQTCRDGNIEPRGLVLHSDNGAPMRGSTMLSTLQWLGIVPSFSRPHVSDDNPYSEALFRTLKYTPAYPRLPFVDLEAARAWVSQFVAWYNGEHRHSGIRYGTPNERHFGQEHAVLSRRRKLYERARGANPERWSNSIRDWSPIHLESEQRRAGKRMTRSDIYLDAHRRFDLLPMYPV